MRKSSTNGSSAPTSKSDRDMLAVGSDIVPGETKNSAKREKRGLCKTCGTQTHKVPMFGPKKPLTIEGRVYMGRCLTCHPIESYVNRPPTMPRTLNPERNQMYVPQTLNIEENDDMDSVVSGITMDIRLVQGERNFSSRSLGHDSDGDDGSEPPPPLQKRPGASVGGDDPYADSRPDTRHRPGPGPPNRKPPPLPPSRNDPYPEKYRPKPDDMLPPGGMDSLFKNRTETFPAPDPRQQINRSSNSEIQFNPMTPNTSNLPPQPMKSMMEDSKLSLDEPSFASGPKYADDFPAETPQYGNGGRAKHPSNPYLPGQRPAQTDKSDRKQAPIETSFAPPLIKKDRRGRPDDDMIQDPMVNLMGVPSRAQLAVGMAHPKNDTHIDPSHAHHPLKTEGEPPIMELDIAKAPRHAGAIGGAAPASHHVTAMMQQLSTGQELSSQNVGPQTNKPRGRRRSSRGKQKEQTIHDIPAILHCMNLDEANTNLREKALYSLSEILWKSGEKARDFILQHKGIDTMVKAMWTDMEYPQVQDAATHFLFSLAASPDGKAASDILSNEESFCDALLFSMQMHASVKSIQLNGCGIFACLAAASSNNKKISDGTLSGALMMVLNAMNNHSDSREIQRAGLHALHLQCELSVNAESNKRSLMESQLENGSSGIQVIVSAMEYLQDDNLAMEWACRLFWCLTSSEDLVKSMSSAPVVILQVMQACQRNLERADAAGLVEASFGVVGNLAHVETNRSDIQGAGMVPIIIKGMRCHPDDYGVSIEACSALANLAVSSPIRESIVKAGGIGTVIRALQSFIGDAEFVGEAIRALTCMTILSEESKETLAIPEVICAVVDASSRHAEVSTVQEMSSAVLATIAVGRGASDVIIDNGGVDVLLRALGSKPDERVQDAACVAYRNLSCQAEDVDPLLQKGATKILVKAMEGRENSVSIQTNACCAVWNLAFKTEREPGTLVGSPGIKSIVKAMQTHLESGELLEFACGALWNLVDNSIDRKKDVVGNGAVDAIVCAVVMHPSRTSTVEKACGIFSNISAEGSLTEAISNAQGVSIVVEAMRNNSNCISLLEVGCTVLRNIVFQFPNFASEASEAVSTVINAMRENIDAIGFQEEACNLLWVLAAEAESCRSKILGLDGIAVLMKCLEQNSHVPGVQDAALGAFNKLAKTQER